MRRHLILLLLIALLPLRGWAVERMSVQMAEVQVGMVQAMPEDCPMQQQDDDPATAHHASCQSCQFCMTLSVASFATLPPASPAPSAAAPSPAERFASAELARPAEPPIS